MLYESYNLINVKDYRMQILIQTPAIYYYAQQGAIFREEQNGFTMHFANHTISENNKRIENWYCMHSKQLLKMGWTPAGSKFPIRGTRKRTVMTSRASPTQLLRAGF